MIEYPESRLYQECKLCPRNCLVNRLAGEKGFCGESSGLRVASASIHKGEEPPITGAGGSGTIFISGCTLRCSFCQNGQISHNAMGSIIDTKLFASICLELQKAGAENINLVTGSHAVPALHAGLREAKTQGLSIPILWNSSAYEESWAIDFGADQIDVYLPDLKTLDSRISQRYFNAPDYPEKATAAIKRMIQHKNLRYSASRSDPDIQILQSGTIIRHLVLPGSLESTKAVLEWFAEHAKGKALLSLMTQYTPVPTVGSQLPSERYVEQGEYEQLLRWLEDYDIEDGFYQELVSSSDWLPDFNKKNPFSSELSIPVWHWNYGFN